MDLGAISATCI